MSSTQPAIGIAGIGTYLPEGVLTAAEIAERSGIPEVVVREKLGIRQKHVGGPGDHPNDMAVRAAEDCLLRTGIAPAEIDVVLCTTEEWKEYLLWTAGIDLAHRIGADRAWAIDLHMRCATTVGALKMAKDMMIADPQVRTVLIAGGYRVSDFIDFTNPRTSFLFNIGAGGGALLLRRDWEANHLLGTHLICDGSLSRSVVVPASGTLEHPSDDAVREKRFSFDLLEPERMKQRLGEVSMGNWVRCVDEALANSGGPPLSREDLDFLTLTLVKPSAHRELLGRLGVTVEQSVYMDEVGHIGEQDAMFGLAAGVAQGKLKDGDLAAVVAAGIGYVWGAAIIRWGLGGRTEQQSGP